MYSVLAVIIGLFVLSALVFVHELGHFVAAKACKIKVLAFALGFGKSLLKWKRGDTEYRLNAIPFGGYVQMAGDDPSDKHEGALDEFYSKPIWQRAVVAVAGPVANFIFAVLALWTAFVYGIDRPVFLDGSKIGVVISQTPADTAGFLAGDNILFINNDSITTWEEIETYFAQQLSSYNVKVERGGNILDLVMRVEKTGAKFPKYPAGGLLPARYPPVIGRVMPKGSADKILAANDTILAINETAVASFDHFAYIMKSYEPDMGPVSLDIKRGLEKMNLFIIPTFDSVSNRYLLGVEPTPELTRLIRYSPIAAIGPTMDKSWEYTVMIFDVLGKLTSGKVSAKQLAGPLNIIPLSGIMAFQGLSSILNFMALIGINLAVLNLLPLVITDGGLLLFLVIEAIRRKPLSMQTQAVINKVFIMLFIALFLFVSFNDIQRLPYFLGWSK